MIGRGKFLCGCDPSRKKNYRFATDNGMLSAKRYDEQGFEICPEHGQRMYGWGSPLVQHKAGQEVLDFSGFGGKRKLKLVTTTPDRRDNRNPVEDHDAIMADWRATKALKNGK
jgi:hypothetical protein